VAGDRRSVAARFAFGGGTFNAREPAVAGGGGTLRAHTTSALAPGSFEAYLAAAAPLRGPLLMRSIGAVFAPGSDFAYFGATLLPANYDLVLWFATTSASVLLPFRYE
jgi:hypothetical protein